MKGSFIRPLFVFFLFSLFFFATVRQGETAIFTQKAYGKKLLSLAPHSFFAMTLAHPDKARRKILLRRDRYYPTSLLVDSLSAIASLTSIAILRNLFLILLFVFSYKLFGALLSLWVLVLFPFSVLIRETSYFSALFFSFALLFPFLNFLKQKKILLLLLLLFLWSISHESFILALSLFFLVPLPRATKAAALLLSVPGILIALPYTLSVPFMDRLTFFPAWTALLFLVSLCPFLWKREQAMHRYLFLWLLSLYLLYPYLIFVKAVLEFADFKREELRKISQISFLQDIYLPQTETVFGILFFAGGIFLSFLFLKQPLPFYRGATPFLEEVKHPRDELFCYGHIFGDMLHQKGIPNVVIDSKGNRAYPPYWTKRLFTLTLASLELPCDAFILPSDQPLSHSLQNEISFLQVGQQHGWQLFYRLTPSALATIPRKYLPLAKRKLSNIFFLQAQEVVRRQQPKKAIPLLEKALTFYPDINIYANLIGLYLSTNQLKKAEKLLVVAKKKSPLHPGILCNQGFLYEKLEKWQQALASYEKCRDFSPPNQQIAAAMQRVWEKIQANKK